MFFESCFRNVLQKVARSSLQTDMAYKVAPPSIKWCLSTYVTPVDQVDIVWLFASFASMNSQHEGHNIQYSQIWLVASCYLLFCWSKLIVYKKKHVWWFQPLWKNMSPLGLLFPTEWKIHENILIQMFQSPATRLTTRLTTIHSTNHHYESPRITMKPYGRETAIERGHHLVLFFGTIGSAERCQILLRSAYLGWSSENQLDLGKHQGDRIFSQDFRWKHHEW